MERFYLTGCPITGREAVCVTSGTRSPPQLEVINLQTGARRVIFDPNGTLRKETFGNVRHLKWKDKWGQSHVGVLVLPPKRERGAQLPVVITGYHCRGFLNGSSGDMVSPFVLAESGVAVLCSDMDLRIQENAYPGRSFSPGQQLFHLQVMLDSWESGVRALKEEGLIDDSRIGISGLSFGAESVWYALTHSTFIAAAEVSDPPWMDPFNYFMYGTADFNQFAFRAMPDPTTTNAAAFYTKASVALSANKVTAPVLEQANDAEFISGMETYTELNRLKRPYEVYIFPDEPHEWVQPRHLVAIQDRTTEWFRFWLQGHEDSARSLLKQYARWERLCLMQRQELGAHSTSCVRGIYASGASPQQKSDRIAEHHVYP
jgi:dipeptidyl aminopeptidase/acylaminoacyl peptidase